MRERQYSSMLTQPQHLMEMSGQLHAKGKQTSNTKWREDWMGLKASPDATGRETSRLCGE
jgi:hypothetical protein